MQVWNFRGVGGSLEGPPIHISKDITWFTHFYFGHFVQFRPMGNVLPKRAKKKNPKHQTDWNLCKYVWRAIINHPEKFPCHFLGHISQIDFFSDFLIHFLMVHPLKIIIIIIPSFRLRTGANWLHRSVWRHSRMVQMTTHTHRSLEMP